MRYWSIFTLAATIVAAPAFADTSAADDLRAEIELPRVDTSLKLADGSDATLHWYERFTFDEGQERRFSFIAPYEEEEVQLTWKAGARWGLNLDLTSRSDNIALPREEFSASAFYQVTPRFRFGGGLSFQTDNIGDTSNWSEDDMEAGVHIESAFSF